MITMTMDQVFAIVGAAASVGVLIGAFFGHLAGAKKAEVES